MQRLRLFDCRVSRLPREIGLCQADVLRIADYVNSAQRRLLLANESGDEGWWGTWAEMAFTVSLPPTTAAPTLPGPYLTTPVEVARVEAFNLCERPIPVFNQFYEYLRFGNGRLPKQFLPCSSTRLREVFTRNNVPTFTDLSPAPQWIVVAFTNVTDVGKRVLIQGLDNNTMPVYTQDGLNRVTGEFLTLQAGIVRSVFQYSSITGIQKDITAGPVQVFQLDPVTGNQVLLVTMQPNEQTASYRRYYFDDLPASCCFAAAGPQTATNVAPQTLSVTAIVKLELLPVFIDTDYCLIQNLEALIEECRSIYFSESDNPNANMAMSLGAHKNAIRLLRGELAHYLGIDEPAVGFFPFGRARLEHQKIGSLL